AHTDGEWPSRGSFANDDHNNRYFQAGHFQNVSRNGLALAPFLCFNARVGTGSIHKTYYGNPKFFSRFHQPKGLSVTFWVGHTKVSVLPCLGVVSFLLAHEHIALVSNLSKSTYHGLVVLYISVTVEFQKSIPADGLDVIHGIGPVRMSRELYPLPCGLVFIDVLAGLFQFLFNL